MAYNQQIVDTLKRLARMAGQNGGNSLEGVSHASGKTGDRYTIEFADSSDGRDALVQMATYLQFGELIEGHVPGVRETLDMMGQDTLMRAGVNAWVSRNNRGHCQLEIILPPSSIRGLDAAIVRAIDDQIARADEEADQFRHTVARPPRTVATGPDVALQSERQIVEAYIMERVETVFPGSEPAVIYNAGGATDRSEFVVTFNHGLSSPAPVDEFVRHLRTIFEGPVAVHGTCMKGIWLALP